jgi:hypothetical protein
MPKGHDLGPLMPPLSHPDNRNVRYQRSDDEGFRILLPEHLDEDVKRTARTWAARWMKPDA